MEAILKKMMSSKQLIEIALLAGEIMLTNGAETHRVEDTMVRICSKGKLKLAESFVIPTVIVATISDENNNLVTVSKRIKSRTIDLNKISLVNQFSRDFQIKDFTYDQAIEILNKIKIKKDMLLICYHLQQHLCVVFPQFCLEEN